MEARGDKFVRWDHGNTSPPPFVSVIVPARNCERTIRDCLISIQRTDYPAERREAIVVDDGSTDLTAEMIRGLPVRYLRGEGGGAAAARNKGIEASRGEILAFTDADCMVTTGWIRELVQGFQGDNVGGVEGETVDYLPRTPAEKYRAMIRSFSYEARRRSSVAPYVITANVAFRRDIFAKIGPFDSRFPAAGGEDVDFTWRFYQETDLKIHYNPRAVVFHRHRSTTRGFLAQQMRNGRGLAILQAKYQARLPWSWRQELRAWGAVARSAGAAASTAIRKGLRDHEEMDIYYAYFAFLGRLGMRLGFLLGALTRGAPWVRACRLSLPTRRDCS